PRGARGHQQDGVVGGHAAVGVEPVEGDGGGGAQRPVEGLGGQVGVGGDDAQHGGQRRGQHARALRHRADHVAAGALPERDLGDGVGGADRVGGGEAAVPARQLVGGLGDAGQQQVHREPHADEAGGAHRDLARRVVQQLGDLLGGGVGVLEAGGAGAGVGAAGVQHDGADPAALEDLLRPQHGRGLDAVAGEDAGGGAGRPVVDDEGDVAVP